MQIKAVTITLLAGISSCYHTLASENRNPNIVLILTDDLGYGDVSIFNPSSKIQTSNIDKIGRQGIVFTDAHSNSSVCTPTRYGILTGRYCWRSFLQQGVLDGYSEPIIKSTRLTIASMLKAKGYSTACIGKWHLGWNWAKKGISSDSIAYDKPIESGPLSLGFDYFYGFSGSLDMPPYVYVEGNNPVSIPNKITENRSVQKLWRKGPVAPDFDHQECLSNLTSMSKKYIEEKANGENPFFLYFAMPAPHTPILPGDGFKGKSGIGDYGDFVFEVDSMIGVIISTLKEKNIFDNTILIVTSDNGCSPAAGTNELEKLGHSPSAQYRGYKADLFEGGHRVPLVVSWPRKIKTGRIRDQLICTTDFMATFAQLTGFKLSDNQGEDSFSFYSQLSGKPTFQKKRKVIVHHSYYGQFSIRKGDWKLLLTPYSGGWSFPQQGAHDKEILHHSKFQLYNLKNDVGEKTNLCDRYPAKVEDLKNLMIRYISNGRSTVGKSQPNDVLVNCSF